MIFLFKNNDKLYLLTIPFLAIITFLFGFYFFYESTGDSCSKLQSTIPISVNIQVFLSLVFSLLNAFYINHVCSKHEITEKQNHLPGAIFIILSSLFLHSPALFSFYLTNLLVLVALDKFLGAYREESSGSKIFDGSFMLGLTMLISPNYIVLSLFPLISLLILKPFNIREWAFSFLGLFTPFCFAMFYFFITDKNIFYPFLNLKQFLISYHAFKVHTHSFSFVLSFCLLILISLINLIISPAVKKIKSQKARVVLLWLFVFSVFESFYSLVNSLLPVTLLIIPFAVFFGDLIATMRKSFLANLLLLFFLFSYFYLGISINS